MTPTSHYDHGFYDKRRGLARSSAEAVVPVVLELVAPQRVVDVGCGEGAWLSVFRERGVAEILGLEGDWLDPAALEIPKPCFRHRDLTGPLGLGERFDLAVSLEVAEHLDARFADSFVANLVALAPVVLFSAAVPYQGGTGHVNEQWPGYWAERFAKHQYVPVDLLRRRIWQDARVAFWYKQNLLLYASEAALRENAALREGAALTPTRPDALVHPDLFLPRVDGRLRAKDMRNLKFRRVIRALPFIGWRSFTGLFRRN